MSHLTNSEVEQVVSDVQMLYTSNYCQLVALIVAIYDHFITFDREVELIWKKRWSKSRILYLVCRYVGNILLFWEVFVFLKKNPTRGFCIWGIRAMSGGAVLSTWTAQRRLSQVHISSSSDTLPVIMQFRIQALYNNKWLSRFLLGVFVGEIISLITIGALSVRGMEVTVEPFPGIFACSIVAFPPYAFAFWIPMLVFDTLLFLLAAEMVIKTLRRLPKGKSRWWRSLAPTLIVIVLRDNFNYFLLVFAAYFTTTVIWVTAEQRYFNIPACFAYATSTIMGCRLVLNLCDAFHNPSSFGTRMGSSPWGTTTNWDDGKPTVNFAPNPVGTTVTTRSTPELGVRGELGMELGTFFCHPSTEPMTLPLEGTGPHLKSAPAYLAASIHC